VGCDSPAYNAFIVTGRSHLTHRKEVFDMLFLPREEGQGLVEYALILVLVAIVVIVILAVLGPTIGNIFSNIVSNV
jgi:pilus assembly protein Flp/PilA